MADTSGGARGGSPIVGVWGCPPVIHLRAGGWGYEVSLKLGDCFASPRVKVKIGKRWYVTAEVDNYNNLPLASIWYRISAK